VQRWCRKGETQDPERLAKELIGGIGRFFGYLRGIGRLTTPTAECRLAPTFKIGLQRFTQFLLLDRGLATSTVENRRFYVDRFLSFASNLAVDAWESLRPDHVDYFLIAQAESIGRRGMGSVCAALHSLFRFLRIEGHDLAPHLEGFPRPRVYDQENVPRFIRPEQIKTMLTLVDRATPAGMRNYAMLLMLITYGMRAAEVARITFDDIDWSGERLCLRHRKSGRSDWMPLSTPVGEAIVEYISKARRKNSHRQIFVTLSAPVRPFRDGSVVSTVAHKYLRAAGIELKHCGAHILRHTAAHELLANGHTFKEIGDYLGHSATSSTSVYLKVDLDGLREVALNDGEDLL
jgi:site-specific recombinase XerD